MISMTNYTSNQQISNKLFKLSKNIKKGKLTFLYDSEKDYFDVIIYNKINIGMFATLIYVNKPDIEEAFERIDDIIYFLNHN